MMLITINMPIATTISKTDIFGPDETGFPAGGLEDGFCVFCGGFCSAI